MRSAVLGVGIDSVTITEAVDLLEKFIAERKPRLVATANAEMVMLAQEDAELSQILNSAALVVPDGAGVVWAAKYNGIPVRERVAGYDLVQALLARAAIRGYSIYFFGAAPGIADKAAQLSVRQYPGLRIAGVRNGYFSAEEVPGIIGDIKAKQADILLVALGVPKQEKWLKANLAQIGVPVAIGVGGSFDVMAGVVSRAPLWMQQTGMEWLYRLLCQPRRILRMMALPRFVYRVVARQKTLDKNKAGIL